MNFPTSSKNSFFLLFFWVLLFLVSSCTEEYSDHVLREQTPLTTSSWSLPKSLEWELSILPDKKILEKLVNTLDTAKRRIWVEIYTWTEKSTIDAVLRAHKRWVHVCVILEWNVYMTPRINDTAFNLFQNAWIEVTYADNTRYSFTHAKMWIIDDGWCVATGNWSYSTFTKNRDFIYCGKDTSLMKNFEEVFLSDFRHVSPYFSWWIDPRLWLSPDNMRSWIWDTIEKTKKNIYIYNQTISDKEILSMLEKKSHAGIDVRICQAVTQDSESAQQKFWGNYTFKMAWLKKPYLHAKLILRDDEEIFLGSVNFTSNALDNNREFAISLWKNRLLYSQLKNLYFADCFP